MRIKRIEISGFKSFCDRTVLNFSEPVTSVVGPNGCGKSNIVDAIRWCMGEQSAKHLRGQAMGDVIFAGSDSRGPADMAEVSLTFEEVGFSPETMQVAIETENAAEGDDGVGEAGGAGGAPPETNEMTPDPEAAGPADGETQETAPANAEPDGSIVNSVDAAIDAAVTHAKETPSDELEEPTISATEEARRIIEDRPPVIDFAQYSEVTITRRLFRDGSSSYFLNKTPCRLRDITDFFLGTGIGTKAYSIIEQGRVGMIVSSRPADRRHIIDEAAGITKFKSKKRAAERKLEQTRNNLLRITDIVAELEKRLGSLKRQAQKAERYRRYKGELKDIELTQASQRYLAMTAERKYLGACLEDARGSLADLRLDYDGKEASCVAERAELGIEERRLSGLQEQMWERDNRIKLSENKVEFQRREARELEQRAISARGEIRLLAAQREQGSTELTDAKGQTQNADSEIQTAELAAVEKQREMEEAKTVHADGQRQLDDIRGTVAAARAEVSNASSKREMLVRRREDSEKRQGSLHSEIEQAIARANELADQVTAFETELNTLRAIRAHKQAELGRREIRGAELESVSSSCEARVETLRTELHRRRSRLQSLEEIRNKYEGFTRGTRAIMQSSEELYGSEANATVRGVVADIVSAPPDFEIAVEAALGDRLGGVLVNTPAAGLRAIHYLKQKSAGRSAFVPFVAPKTSSAGGIQVEDHTNTSMPADSGTAEMFTAPMAAQQAAPAQSVTTDGSGATQSKVSTTVEEIPAGILGRMVDVVSFGHGFEHVGRSLLRDFFVVDSLDRALELHENGMAGTLVTLEGDVVDDRGVVFGGSRDTREASVLAQKREIRELEEIVEILDTDLTRAVDEQVEVRRELAEIRDAVATLRNALHAGELAMTARDRELISSSSELSRLRSRLERLTVEKSEIDSRLESVEAEHTDLGESEEAARVGLVDLEQRQLTLIREVTAGQYRVDGLSTTLTTARVRVAQFGEQRASLAALIMRLENTQGELGERQERLEGAIREDSERAEILLQECDDIAEELVEVRTARREIAESLEAGRVAYEQRLGNLNTSESGLREMRGKVDAMSQRAGHLELDVDKVESRVAHLEETIGDRYGIELARHIGDFHLRTIITADQEKRLEELRRLIQRMGGDINLTAIEEYAEISERYEFLSTQKIDLDNACDQLEKAIDKINKTSRRLFRETFDSINRTFKELFPRLFRGGHARLSLTGGDDVDILDAGVEIMAQPPGKKNATVDQLSGGEKALTAVALIFAIFLVKPSPFCLLDEVDAPLDDVNVDRYNEIVREMTDRSQFIVITHNKRTMEIADRLYGVTMQEPGVSKIVSVNLAKIDETIAA